MIGIASSNKNENPSLNFHDSLNRIIYQVTSLEMINLVQKIEIDNN